MQNINEAEFTILTVAVLEIGDIYVGGNDRACRPVGRSHISSLEALP
jgi:hypothetical protein